MIPEARRILALSLPMIAAQLGNMLLGVVDTLVVGHAGTSALAAMALGHVWLWGTLMVANGIVMGVDPLISQAHGAGDERGVGVAFQRGLVFALLASIPLGALWLATEPVLVALGQDPALSRDAARLVRIQAPTAAGFLLFTVGRQYLATRGLGRVVVLVVVAANVVNALLCTGLVLGRFGLPALGLVGAGLSQGAARLFMGAALLLATFGLQLHRGAWAPWSRASFDPGGLARIFAVGLPLGVTFGLEVWAFQISALVSGRLGPDSLAANTIVLNLAALAFMVPLGIALGASIRVGNLVGAGTPEVARRSALAAFGLATTATCLSATAFLVFRHALPHLYGASAEVSAIAAAVFPIAAAFQLFDGAQVVAAGVLRGLGRTRPAAVLNLVVYYAIGLPLGYALAFPLGLGLRGLWWGLALGLAVVALGTLPLTVRRSAFERARRIEG